jgi:hypothetical protein
MEGAVGADLADGARSRSEEFRLDHIRRRERIHRIELGCLFHLDTAPLRNFAADLNALETAAYAVQQRPNGSIPAQNEGSPGDTLAQISALTGGRMFPTDTTAQAINEAASDALRVNYRMAFSPDRLDGKYHKIRVTASRGDIKIQTAQNYYAVAGPEREQKERLWPPSAPARLNIRRSVSP